jgi:multidrug transporter EmrE-like cation transporter
MTSIGWVLVLLSAGLQVAGTLLLRGGIDRAGGFGSSLAEVPTSLLRLVSQPLFLIGFIFYGLAALVWFRVIATQPLSTAYPLLVSLTFIFVTLGAIVFYHESFSWLKAFGLGIILTGVLIVGGK